MRRITFEKSKETGCYEIVKIEPFSEAEEAQYLNEAREKALKDKNARMYSIKLEIVKKLLKTELSIEQISEATGLVIKEIEKNEKMDIKLKQPSQDKEHNRCTRFVKKQSWTKTQGFFRRLTKQI